MGDSPLASLRCKSRCGRARSSFLGRGLDRLGKSWSAVARRGQPLMISALRASALSAGFLGIQIWLGMSWLGSTSRGRVRLDMVIAADSSTELFRRLPAALFGEQMRRGQVRRGAARCATARSGQVRSCKARTADGSTEGSPSLLFSREQVWSGPASRGPLG